MTRYLTVLVVLLLSASMSFAAPSQTPSKKEQFELFAASRRHTQEFNKFAYFVIELRRTADEYKENPRRFDKHYQVKDELITEQQSLDQVLHERAAALRTELKPTDYTVIKAGLKVAPVPSWVKSAGEAALTLLPEFNNRNPEIVRKRQDDAIEYGYMLGQQQDVMGDEVNKASIDWLTAAPRSDLSDSPPVQQFVAQRDVIQKLHSEQEREDFIKEAVSRASDQLGSIRGQLTQLEERDRTAQAKADAEAEYTKNKGEVLGALELVGYAFSANGDRQWGKLASASAYAFGRYADLVHNADEMGSLALTAGYIGTTVTVLNMLNDGSDPTQAALRQISAQISQLRGEMHERFDRVDAALDGIWRELDEGFAQVSAQQLQTAADMKREFSDLNVTLTRAERRIIDLQDSMTTSFRKIELDLQQGRLDDLEFRTRLLEAGKDVDASLIFFETVVGHDIWKRPFAESYADWRSRTARERIVALSPVSGDPLVQDVDMSSALQILAVIRSGAGALAHVGEIPNLAAWQTTATSFERVLQKQPKLAESSATAAIRESGEALQVRWQALFGQDTDLKDLTGHDTVNALLINYEHALAAFREELEKEVTSAEQRDAHGVDVYGNAPDLSIEDPRLEPIETGPILPCQSMAKMCEIYVRTHFCKPASDHDACPSSKRNCEDAAKGYEQVTPLGSMPLTSKVLPNEYLLADRLGIASLKTCFLSPTPFELRTGELETSWDKWRAFFMAHRAIRVAFIEEAAGTSEVVRSPWVLVTCDFCSWFSAEGGWRKYWKDAMTASNQQFTRLWEQPGGGRDQMLNGQLRDSDPTLPMTIKASPEFAQLYSLCFGVTPPNEEASALCWPSGGMLDEREAVGRTYPQREQFLHAAQARPWLMSFTFRAPLWREQVYRADMAARVAEALRSQRVAITEQLRASAHSGVLADRLSELDAARLVLQAAVELGYSESFLVNDALRGLFRGRHAGSALLDSNRAQRELDATDATGNQRLTVERKGQEAVSLAHALLERLGPSEPFSQLTDQLQRLPGVR